MVKSYKGPLHKKRVANMKLALSMADVIVADPYVMDVVIRVFDKVEELGGDFTLRDASLIRSEVQKLKDAEDKKKKPKDN